MKRIASMLLAVGVVGAQAAIFTQDFSSSTNAGDYIELTTPSQNQFTLVDGGPVSIDTGRLKIVNAEGTAGNVRRWVDMVGTPVAGMSFSFEMDITVAAGYAANTRLSTGTIGSPHFMAWGIDATGLENEWNVTGTPTVKFTGPQTVTIFMNDSLARLTYTDPAAGEQELSAYSYDVWVGTTLVADGKTKEYVHPENELSKFNIGLTAGTAATWHFDNFEVLDLPVGEAITVYEDDFSGSAGVATNTVPGVSPAGFEQLFYKTGLDGAGRLQSTAANVGDAGYRVKLGTAPLTDDASIKEISCAFTMRAPTNAWVMVGFQEERANGLLIATNNVGPIVQFGPNYVLLRGGTWTGGNTTPGLYGYFSAGEEIAAKMTYHVAEQTIDLVINGTTVTNGWVLNHEFPAGTLSDSVVYWLQAQLRLQPSAAAGGAYIDSWRVETVAAGGYAGWAGEWGVNLGGETADYDGDGLSNVYEYGLGGDPTNALDQGTSPTFGPVDVGGTDYFGYVYPQLAASENSGLSYSLELNTDLVTGTWVNSGYQISGTNVTGGGELDFVTNVTDTVESQKFIRLIIE